MDQREYFLGNENENTGQLIGFESSAHEEWPFENHTPYGPS
jgi:hypothetical protein